MAQFPPPTNIFRVRNFLMAFSVGGLFLYITLIYNIYIYIYIYYRPWLLDKTQIPTHSPIRKPIQLKASRGHYTPLNPVYGRRGQMIFSSGLDLSSTNFFSDCLLNYDFCLIFSFMYPCLKLILPLLRGTFWAPCTSILGCSAFQTNYT